MEGFRVNRVEANRVFPLDMPQLTPKTPLYRNFDQAFDKLLAKPSAERKLSVEIEFLDNPFGFTLCMEDETGARIMLTEPFAKELARREQQDNIRTQLSKLGNTPSRHRRWWSVCLKTGSFPLLCLPICAVEEWRSCWKTPCPLSS